jgi:hypothetical protein
VAVTQKRSFSCPTHSTGCREAPFFALDDRPKSVGSYPGSSNCRDRLPS